MGMNQPFRTSANWNEAIQMLDATFPLAEGSHRTVIAYCTQFDHLAVIHEDGTTTGLKKPAQFREAGGNPECPQSILLEHDGLQVEIEPSSHKVTTTDHLPQHRLQLLTAINMQ